MNRHNRIVTLAAVVASSGTLLGLARTADAQTRAQAPRPDAGRILSKSFQQPDNDGGDQGRRAPTRNPLRTGAGAAVGGGGVRFIVDRDGRRAEPRRARLDHDRHDHDGDRDHDHDWRDRRRHHHHDHHDILLPGLGYSFFDWGYSSTGGYAYETPTVIVIENPAGPAVRTNEIDGPEYVEPPPPPTTTEIALAAMARGDWEDAVARWRERLAEAPEDAGAVRYLGLSMAMKGDMQTGAAMVAHAYQMSPQLAHERLDVWALGGERELRRSLRRFVVYANSRETESAWLTVAALMQAEGRDDHAARMVEKARAAGLAPEIADPFKAALGG